MDQQESRDAETLQFAYALQTIVASHKDQAMAQNSLFSFIASSIGNLTEDEGDALIKKIKIESDKHRDKFRKGDYGSTGK